MRLIALHFNTYNIPKTYLDLALTAVLLHARFSDTLNLRHLSKSANVLSSYYILLGKLCVCY
jgi:hypothetical protein